MIRPHWPGTSTARSFQITVATSATSAWPTGRGAWALARRLFDQFFRQMTVDAGELGAPLPFVIWESHRPHRTRRRTTGICGPRGRSFSIASAGSGSRGWTSCRRTSRREEATTPRSTAPVVRQAGRGTPDQLVRRGTTQAGRLRVCTAKSTATDRAMPDVYDRTLPPDLQPRLRPAKLAGVPMKAIGLKLDSSQHEAPQIGITSFGCSCFRVRSFQQ